MCLPMISGPTFGPDTDSCPTRCRGTICVVRLHAGSAIWALSGLPVPALTASGEPVLTSLGQPMTLGQRLLLGQRWHGTLNLRDEATMRRFDDYARRR